jgi:peptide/nickel transport system permease protein
MNANQQLSTSDRAESLTAKRIKRFRRHKLAMFGLIFLAILVFGATCAPVLSKYTYKELDLRNRYVAPNPTHWLGTDGTGRDIWARLLMGGRVSLSVGLVAMSISSGIGVILGGLSGYFGGKLDTVIMRFTDMVMCFPPLIIIIVLVAVLGPSIYNTMAAIGLLGWPGIARLVRGSFLSLRETEFVQAAHCIGASSGRIIFRHILPNALGPVIVAATLGVASAILMEAGLSFLGLGVQPPTPSWGNMLNQAQNLTMVQDMPWLWIPAGTAIILSVLSINFIGDGLRDAFDPRQSL